MRCPFLLRLCQEVLLRVFKWFFFFRCLFCRKRKVNAECVSLPHEWNRRPHTAGKPGRMIVVVCAFHASGDVFFLLVILFFTDFPLKFFSTQSASVFVYLHFAPFSEPHQSVFFVLGAKVIPGLDGKARSSLLFSAEISSPSGSISPKNLAFPNPYLFKHPKRKRPMRQKDA